MFATLGASRRLIYAPSRETFAIRIDCFFVK